MWPFLAFGYALADVASSLQDYSGVSVLDLRIWELNGGDFVDNK
jgi:hypothetical protein